MSEKAYFANKSQTRGSTVGICRGVLPVMTLAVLFRAAAATILVEIMKEQPEISILGLVKEHELDGM